MNRLLRKYFIPYQLFLGVLFLKRITNSAYFTLCRIAHVMPGDLETQLFKSQSLFRLDEISEFP